MKYLIFLIAFMGVLPLGYILTLNRKYMRYAFLAVLLPVMAFNQVSINFFLMKHTGEHHAGWKSRWFI